IEEGQRAGEAAETQLAETRSELADRDGQLAESQALADAVAAELRQGLEQSGVRVAELEAQQKAANETHQELEANLVTTLAQLSDAEQARMVEAGRAEALANEISGLKAEVDPLREQRADARAAAEALGPELETARSATEAAGQELETALRGQLADAEAKLGAEFAARDALANQMLALQTELTELHTQLESGAGAPAGGGAPASDELRVLIESVGRHRNYVEDGLTRWKEIESGVGQAVTGLIQLSGKNPELQTVVFPMLEDVKRVLDQGRAMVEKSRDFFAEQEPAVSVLGRDLPEG
ncbi:MAG: hypothetical protein QGH45_08465, partial [Myxococcota bacterium]|nr:hypothetical protein [Myxococcota bacterium]